MKQKIFLIIGIVILSIVGISIYNEFMLNHTYYYSMFGSRDNRNTIIRAIISSLIPILYLLFNKKFSLKDFAIKRIPIWLIFFGISHILIKETIFWSTWFIILCINTLLIYFMSIYFTLGTLSLGTRISNKWIKLWQTRWQEIFINFWIWLWAFLLLIKLLLIFNLLFGIVSRILFIGLWIMIYLNKNQLSDYKIIIEDIFAWFKKTSVQKNPILRIAIILIAISIIYYFYGFQLSYIPYSTAWDANHAYMYMPKVFAANNWVLRGNVIWWAAPQLRHSFITFWFSLFWSIKFWIGSDTVAVAMNFISAMYVLIMGIGTIQEIISFFAKDNNKDDNKDNNIDDNIKSKNLPFYLGWFLVLLWLTSWMWAFLVFVDNKTDLWVMSITILAVLSWFIFLNHVKNNGKTQNLEHKSEHTEHKSKKEIESQSLKYIIISWCFFALASMSKQTAFIDIALFWLIIIALRIDVIVAIWFGIIIVWITGILKIANAPDLISTTTGNRVVIVWLLITIVWIIKIILQKKTKIWLSIKYILLRAWSIVAMLAIFKAPHVVYEQILDKTISPSNIVKSVLLGTANSITWLNEQTIIDQVQKNNLTLAQCNQLSFTKEELEKTTTKAISSNEDVGRYVGYGRKEINKSWWLNVWYGLLRLIYPKDNTCYGLNHDAKILCKDGVAVDNFDVARLEYNLSQMKTSSQTYNILSWALQKFYNKWYKSTDKYNPTEFRDQIVSLRQFYQSHSIRTEKWKISVPYRYIIPLNISFNWSLQNLSSYYTDIWYMRLFCMIFIIIGFIYWIIQKDIKLIALTAISMLWWTIWWMIWWWILWYWMWLIIWTILATIIYIDRLIHDTKWEKNQNILYVMLFLFTIRWLLQLFFNLIRISSQWAGWPFARYKMNIGKTMEFDDNLQQKEVIKNGYGRKDVFDMQFPHYNKFINYIADRKNNDWVLIAGTYIQYFLWNQRNITNDWMLGLFWEKASDWDSCKASKRLALDNIKYLVVDPNIGTVGMWEGNESLFQRFFAKLDPVTWKIQTHWAISMLVKLNQDWYIKLFNTNNLGAKYAFTLDDNAIIAGFGSWMTAEDLIFTRSKLAIARYFPDANQYINFIATTLSSRLENGLAIWDIADIYGKTIDEAKLLATSQKLSSWAQLDQQSLQAEIKTLSQDERLVLAQYMWIRNLLKSWNQQLQEVINNLLWQSLWWSSQLMIFERL